MDVCRLSKSEPLRTRPLEGARKFILRFYNYTPPYPLFPNSQPTV